ncbi:hypothetical protein ULMA_19820 [Patiriisocius marinus]|uniref:Uncharacterized protein n=1 Tax=Patiriisocius marinus TaxID=1397112 RepID=A0A5J4IY23_9FLAO|nr:hypothetical protein [Patiriisocius marinus]GER59874.1 hypothetical protein ULMA_19820 [Patiriisocius marinus]
MYANTLPTYGVDNFYEHIQNNIKDVQTSSENVFFKISKEKEDNLLFAEINEYEEVETNSESSTHQLTSVYGYLLALFSSQPLDALSKKLQNDVVQYIPHLDTTSTRLHVKFQVFII